MKLPPGRNKDAEGTVLARWQPANKKEHARLWKNEAPAPRDGATESYRIVARDNCPHSPHTTTSALITFNRASHGQVAKERNALEDKASVTVTRIIQLQRKNITRTRMYQGIIDSSTAEQWGDTAASQQEIRTLAKALLANRLRPLGKLEPVLRGLYAN